MKKNILLLLVAIALTMVSLAQTPGLIIKPAQAPGNAVLDPDGDGYVSQKTNGVQLGFTNPPDNDVTQSEIPYVAIIRPDPLDDILRGPVGGFIEIVGVDEAGNNAILTYNDGTNLLFRFRLGGYAPNSKSYSLLIDTDGKFGLTGPNADPNAISGNLGFEVEIVLKTNFTVDVYNCDGLANNATLVKSYSYDTNCHKAMAITNGGGDPDYFYDFFVNLADISSVISSTTPLRIVALTTMNPHAAIGNNALSDVGGVTSGNNIDEIFTELIEDQTPTPPGEEVLDRSACPTINSVNSTAINITGSSTEADGTTITVYVYQSNGSTLIGSGTTTVTSGAWSISVASLSPAVTLANDQVVKATAQATGKGVSYNNCSIQTVSSCTTSTNVPVSAEVVKISGSKGFDIVLTSTRPVGTKVYLYTSNYTLRGVSDLKNGVTNPYTTISSPQTFSFECQTGNCFGTDVYYVRFEEPGKCISPIYVACDYATGTSATPAITTSSITTSTTTLTGTGTTASSQIFVYADGNPIANTTAGTSDPYNWTATIPAQALCNVITVRQIVAGACLSDPTAGITVTRQASKPTITSSSCSATPPATVSGVSSENGATVTLYKVGTPDVSLGTGTVTSGEWSINPSPALASGDVLYARVSSGTCLTASANSESVTITTKTSNIPTITTNPILEGATTLSGTGTNGDVITLYIGGALAYNNLGETITTTVSGTSWSISAIPANELFIGASVYVTATSPGKCEGDASGSLTVQCINPSSPVYSGGNYPYCVGNAGSISLLTSEILVMYQLVDASGTAVGPASAGTGSGITLYTNALSEDLTNIYVKAFKIGYNTCSATASTVVNFTPSSPTPSVTFTTTSLTVAKGTTSVNLPYSEKSSSPVADNYTIDFGIAANSQGFVDVTAPTALPGASGNISIVVPAGANVGTYSATIKINQSGGTGCSRYYGFTITVYDGGGAPLINTQPAGSTICANNTGTISVTTTNATGYQWQIATAFSGPFSNVVDGSATTTDNTNTYTTGLLTATRYYRVVVSNINGNTISTVATVTVSPAPSAAGAISGNSTVCSGQNNVSYSVGSILNATSYVWAYSGTGVSLNQSSNTALLSFGSSATSGNLTVKGSNSCGVGAEATLTITVNQTPAINNKTKDACSGAAFEVLSADLSGTVPVGTTYSWSAPTVTGGLTGSASGSGAASITGTLTNPTTTAQTATYTVTPIAGGCTGATFTVTVTLSAPITATATGTNPLCFGGANGSISLAVSGGTPAYTYDWGGGVTTQNRSGITAGTYNVTVTDSKGCTKTASATLTNPAEISIAPVVTNVSCNGGSNGEISLSITNGTAPYTYLWENGSTSATRTGLAAGTYSVTVTDANGCSKASGDITVTQPATGITPSVSKSDILCFGGTSTLDASASSGGTGTLQYKVNSGTYKGLSTTTAVTASESAYIITVKDGNNCTATTSITVSQPAALVLTPVVGQPTCPAVEPPTPSDPSVNATGSITLGVAGGTGTKTYAWTASGTGEVPPAQVNSQNLTGIKAGTYSVTVTDGNGCTKSATVNVTSANPNPVTPGTITE